MKEHHTGALLNLDRKSRGQAAPQRPRMTSGWVSLTGRQIAGAGAVTNDEELLQPWLRPLPLWLAAFRSGRLPLLWAAEKSRRKIFQKQVQLKHFFAIQYVAPPASLLDELAWLRELGVQQVVVPLEQGASDVQQVKALGAIQNLHIENCRVAAVLRPKRGAPEEPEVWHQFCYWMLSQAGWQLDAVQLTDGLDDAIRESKDGAELAKLFAHVPRLRRDYPGVALLAPGIERFDAVLPVKALQKLLPEACAWDGVILRMPAWQAVESVGREGVMLRRLVLAGAVAAQPEIDCGRVQACFPAPPSGCDAAAAERIAGSVVRRSVLVLASGVVERVALEINPAMHVDERQVLSTAIRELVSQLAEARFERRLRLGDANRDFVLEFSRSGKPPVLIGWTDGDPKLVSVPFRVGAASDFLCRQVPMIPHPRIRLTRDMAYFAVECLGSR